MYNFYYKDNGIWYKSKEIFTYSICTRMGSYFYPNNESGWFNPETITGVNFEKGKTFVDLSMLWQARMVQEGCSYLRINQNEGETASTVYLGLLGFSERQLGYYFPLSYTSYVGEKRNLYLAFRVSTTQCEEAETEEDALTKILKIHSYQFLEKIGLRIVRTNNMSTRLSSDESTKYLS